MRHYLFFHLSDFLLVVSVISTGDQGSPENIWLVQTYWLGLVSLSFPFISLIRFLPCLAEFCSVTNAKVYRCFG